MLKPITLRSEKPRGAPAKPLGVAVVGLGWWGPSLLRVLGENLDAEVRWICDLDRGRLERYRHRHPTARITARFDRILADPAVDAVVIATPVYTHYALAAQAVEAGKHVFVEEPLAPSSELADELTELARERGQILVCGHTFLYDPYVRAIKRLIGEGKLGDVYFISSSRVRLGLRQRDVSVIADLGPHDLSVLLYWLSETPSRVRAVGRETIEKGIADVAFVTLTFASGVVAHIELSWLAPSRLRRTVLVGSERMAVYDDGAEEPLRLFERGGDDREPDALEERLVRGPSDAVVPWVEPGEPLALQIDDFVAAVRAGDRMEFQAAVAQSVVRVVEAADLSLSRGGEEVLLRNEDTRLRPLVA